MEGNENKGNVKKKEEIFSQVIRAGKRTYFFDVRSTYNDDYYLTITESKRRFNRQGRHFYEKHKIFLYKEDFDEFLDAMQKAIEFIKINRPNIVKRSEMEENNLEPEHHEDLTAQDYDSGVEFDDLGDSNVESENPTEE